MTDDDDKRIAALEEALDKKNAEILALLLEDRVRLLAKVQGANTMRVEYTPERSALGERQTKVLLKQEQDHLGAIVNAVGEYLSTPTPGYWNSLWELYKRCGGTRTFAECNPVPPTPSREEVQRLVRTLAEERAGRAMAERLAGENRIAMEALRDACGPFARTAASIDFAVPSPLAWQALHDAYVKAGGEL